MNLEDFYHRVWTDILKSKPITLYLYLSILCNAWWNLTLLTGEQGRILNLINMLSPLSACFKIFMFFASICSVPLSSVHPVTLTQDITILYPTKSIPIHYPALTLTSKETLLFAILREIYHLDGYFGLFLAKKLTFLMQILTFIPGKFCIFPALMLWARNNPILGKHFCICLEFQHTIYLLSSLHHEIYHCCLWTLIPGCNCGIICYG